MSLIKCPTDGWWKHWFFITKINIYESPSKLELCKPSSWRNLIALLAAIVSNTTINDGRGMISNRAAIISSEELRTTTLISTAPNSSKTAPPKLFSEHLGQVASRQIASGAVCWQIYHAGLETPEGAALPNPKVCPVEPLPL